LSNRTLQHIVENIEAGQVLTGGSSPTNYVAGVEGASAEVT
jgi:hypothetical protein